MSSSRPSPMKRQSSQSSHTSRNALSPASLGEQQPVRHHVKPGRKTKIQLPRAYGSGRNLVKLAEESRRSSKQKPRESETEIRLPGSLDDRPPTLRRNYTATHLPRNLSHTKLKKNLSHGQLTKLGVLPSSTKGPPSPALKGRAKRPKSADMAGIEKDLHEQEVELAYQQQHKHDGLKKVGFAVGSSDGSDVEDLPQMDGQGLQEDEWTDQSASASPFSTRQNSAHNSRRASVVMEKPLDRRAVLNSKEHASRHSQPSHLNISTHADSGRANDGAADNVHEDEEDDEEPEVEQREATNPRSAPPAVIADNGDSQESITEAPPESMSQRRNIPEVSSKEHANPTTRRLLSRNSQSPAPALVSNVSALDNVRTNRSSPSASMTSSRSNIQADADEDAEEEEEELVSRFMPTGSGTHPTPTTRSMYTPESEGMLASRPPGTFAAGSSFGPVSPESARSLSIGGGHLPAFGKWRNEEKMMNEKAMAELEDAAAKLPIIPPHVFDRRNESLKSYLNLASLSSDGRGGLNTAAGRTIGPELFEGRFKAVNTELKMVQRFRDPTAESIARMHQCKECDMTQLRGHKASSSPQQDKQLHISKSTTALQKQASKLGTSASPPKPSLTSAKSATQIKRSDTRRGKVAFSQVNPGLQESPFSAHDADGRGADVIAKRLWDASVV